MPPARAAPPIFSQARPHRPPRRNPHHAPPPYSYGIFTALNRTHATWSFKTVKADGGGPADYTDNLTIVRAH